MKTSWLLIMKKLTVLLILFAVILSGCSNPKSSQIAATTLPVYTFITELCEGTDISVSRLVTENISCLHDYTLQVSQMRAIEQADAVVMNGADLEEFLEDALKNANHIIDASADIPLRCGHQHEGHEHNHDPHIWLSTANAKQMCMTICAELSSLYPKYASQFESNLQDLLKRLDDLQIYGETALQNVSCRELITFHDGFSYFAESFGLEIIKAIEEESGSEASAMELIELIDLVETRNIPAIFTEKNGSTAAAEIVANETGVQVFALDMAISGNDYFDAMRHNVDTLKEALE
ncbi:MAG: zinc ABC transporter substrate-binding protein [Oscillospiraceae bacterium]|nr:zinc ABC transporter substrate-binding protein [Oscillospiraceae bacterium]